MDQDEDNGQASRGDATAVGIPGPQSMGQHAGPAEELAASGSGLPAPPLIVLTPAPSRSFSRAPSDAAPATTRARGAAKRGLSAIPEQGDAPPTKKQKHT